MLEVGTDCRLVWHIPRMIVLNNEMAKQLLLLNYEMAKQLVINFVLLLIVKEETMSGHWNLGRVWRGCFDHFGF